MSQEKGFRQKDQRDTKPKIRSLQVGFTQEQTEAGNVEVHQQKAQQDSNTQILIDLAKDVKGMKTTMEYPNRNPRRPGYRGRYGRGRGRNNFGNNQNSFGNNQTDFGNNQGNQNTEVKNPGEKGEHLNS